MSEPMSALEIEDVLSSIRRLVSEELRPVKRVSRGGVSPDTKLMLTPALRVVSDAIGEPIRDTGSVIGRVADALAPESDFEAETGDPEPQALGISQAWQQEDDVEAAGMAIDAEADDFPAEKLVFRSRQVLGDKSVLILGAEPASFLEGPHPEIVERLMDEEVWAQHASQDDDETIETDEAVDEVIPTTAAIDEISQAGPISEPEADNAWADRAEAEAISSLAEGADGFGFLGETPDRASPPRTDMAVSEGEMRFDETVLRDLVRNLIREELQGTLGERITRNVRKLVRVEVARALSLHDFE